MIFRGLCEKSFGQRARAGSPPCFSTALSCCSAICLCGCSPHSSHLSRGQRSWRFSCTPGTRGLVPRHGNARAAALSTIVVTLLIVGPGLAILTAFVQERRRRPVRAGQRGGRGTTAWLERRMESDSRLDSPGLNQSTSGASSRTSSRGLEGSLLLASADCSPTLRSCSFSWW